MENITKNLQLGLLTIILISTVIAVGIEIKTMYMNKSVTLADLLLMFLISRGISNGQSFLEPTIN